MKPISSISLQICDLYLAPAFVLRPASRMIAEVESSLIYVQLNTIILLTITDITLASANGQFLSAISFLPHLGSYSHTDERSPPKGTRNDEYLL